MENYAGTKNKPESFNTKHNITATAKEAAAAAAA